MDPVRVALDFVGAINASDVGRVGELLSEDHLFVDSGGVEIRGRDAALEAWRHYFRMVPDYHVEVDATFAEGVTVVLLGVARGTLARNDRLDPAGRWSTPAAWRTVIDEGRVAVWQVYADNEPIRRIMRRRRSPTG